VPRNGRARYADRTTVRSHGFDRDFRHPAPPFWSGPRSREYVWVVAVLAVLVLEVGLAAMVLALR
jgi:hypothetical protein